jgi:hypothetical protein
MSIEQPLHMVNVLRFLNNTLCKLKGLCSYEQNLSWLARKHFEISPCNKIDMKSYISFIRDEK